jgi:hypothetical protein
MDLTLRTLTPSISRIVLMGTTPPNDGVFSGREIAHRREKFKWFLLNATACQRDAEQKFDATDFVAPPHPKGHFVSPLCAMVPTSS